MELWQHESCPLLGVEPARKQNSTRLRSTHSGFYQSLYFYLHFPTLTRARAPPPSPPHHHPTHNSPSTFYPVTFRIFPSIPCLSCFVAALALLCPTLPLIAISFTLFFYLHLTLTAFPVIDCSTLPPPLCFSLSRSVIFLFYLSLSHPSP